MKNLYIDLLSEPGVITIPVEDIKSIDLFKANGILFSLYKTKANISTIQCYYRSFSNTYFIPDSKVRIDGTELG